MFDIIGDIHGHADELISLLNKLGYQQANGVFSHSERKVLFVGDYIDRGPKIKEVLRIVRGMVENDRAIALMGNHEYNAICFHYPEREGGHLRKHLIKNVLQHYETLKAFKNSQSEYEDYIDWFITLPLFYENELFRAVHACWDHRHIELLRRNLINDQLDDDLIYQSTRKDSALYLAVEEILKGKELNLPNEISFYDKDGHQRSAIRTKWWEDPEGASYRSLSVEERTDLPDEPVQISEFKKADFYSSGEKPVFFGHYWLKHHPSIFKPNVCCLDYSVAKGGKLVAYRFDGEQILKNEKFVFV